MFHKFSDMMPSEQIRTAKFSETIGLQEIWSVVGDFTLYASDYQIARLLSVAELFKTTLEVRGAVADFGCATGANSMYLAKLLRIYDPLSTKRVHCFTDFNWNIYPAKSSEHEPFERMLRTMNLLHIIKEMAIHRGQISEIVPKFLSESNPLRFSFVYCDVLEGAQLTTVLDLVAPRLSPGGLIVLHQYGWETFPEATGAVEEFLERQGEIFEPSLVRDTRMPTLALRKRQSDKSDSLCP